jgi:4-carboxymuconolactone decarboxylase
MPDMPRLPEVTDRNALPDDKQDAFDYLVKTRGAVRLPFSVILNNPEVCYRVAHVGSYIRFESSLPDNIRELAVLASAREFDVRFEWAAHARIASEAGISDATIDVIANKKELDGLSEEEALPIRFARELLRNHRASNETWSAAQSKYGDQGAIEIITTVGYYAMLGCLLNGLEIEPAADAPQLP